MFTGIIEGLGTIKGIQQSGQGQHITIDADFTLASAKVGDSVAVSGACLTAVVISGKRFEVDVSPETLENTTFRTAKIGDRVNLERALRLSDRIDGHLVSGHIDGTGSLFKRQSKGNAIIITVGASRNLTRHMIHKGSVAVDGISLTINRCDEESFDVSIIPHTAGLTTIGFKQVGDSVNIETDMIGKYVERLMSPTTGNGSSQEEKKTLDMQFLVKTGFL